MSRAYEAAMFFALKQPLGSTYSEIDQSKFSPTGFGHEYLSREIYKAIIREKTNTR